MALPLTEPLSGLAPSDTNRISVSADNQYAATTQFGDNQRLNAHYGANTPLLSATEGDFTQPIVDGQSFTTIRIPGSSATGLDLACGAVSTPGTSSQMAVIGRGTCSFADKANNVAAAGYGGMLVVNSLRLSGAIGMGGGQRTDNFRSLMVSFEVGTDINKVPSGQLLTLNKVSIPLGYTRLWDIRNLTLPKVIASIETPNTRYVPIVNPGVDFSHYITRLDVSNHNGRLILSAGSDGFTVYRLRNLNTQNPQVTLSASTGLLPIDTSLVSQNEFLGQQPLVDFFNANTLFGAVNIDFAGDLRPYTINGTKVLLGVKYHTGLVIYADPAAQ